MPPRCKLCGAANATCGTPTRTLPVDARITGVRVAGDTLVPDLTTIQPTDMTNEEREEFVVMAEAYERRRNRLKIGAQAMADGKVAFTSLVYVQCADGITRKMHPDVAQQYVDMNEGSEIVREGALPVPSDGEPIGATKATVGAMFEPDGTQIRDVQPMTTRTFLATDRTREEIVNPPIGSPVTSTATATDTGVGSSTDTGARKPTMKPAATSKPTDSDKND